MPDTRADILKCLRSLHHVVRPAGKIGKTYHPDESPLLRHRQPPHLTRGHDPGRRRRLLEHLKGVQTLVTCTDPDDLAGAEAGAIYRVSGAKIEREL